MVGIKGRVYMIRSNMCFDDFCDFYSKRKFIRALYKNISSDEKATYKYYVYSRRILKEKVCDMIWEYLNAVEGEDYAIKQTILTKERSKYL